MKVLLNDEILQGHIGELRKIILKNFRPWHQPRFIGLKQWISDYQTETGRFIQKLALAKDKDDPIRLYHDHIAFRKTLIEKLNTWSDKPWKADYKTFISPFLDESENFLNQSPRFWISLQAPERFSSQESDTRKIRFFKFIKRVGYNINKTPVRSANRIRKLFGRQAIPEKPWRQKIPVKKISKWCFENQFLSGFTSQSDEVLKVLSLLAYELWMIDNAFFVSLKLYFKGELKQQEVIDKWAKEWKPAIEKISERTDVLVRENDLRLEENLDSCSQLFCKLLETAGTIEFSNRNYRDSKQRKNLNRIKRNFAGILNKRSNTIYILADDWKFNQEIYILKANAQRIFLIFRGKLSARVATVGKSLEKIPKFLHDTINRLQTNSHEQLRKTLIQLKEQAQKSLTGQIVPEISDILLEQAFPVVADEAEQGLLAELKAMTSSRILIENFDPATAYSEKSMQATVPLELIEFGIMKRAAKVFLSCKSDTIEKLESARSDLENMGTMVSFNLDSAIAMLDETGTDNTEASLIEAGASMQRALHNSLELTESFTQFFDEQISMVENTISNFDNELSELTDNTKVARIRYLITRARTLKRSEKVWLVLKTTTTESAIKIKTWYRFSKRKLDTGIDTLRDQLGIQNISADISFEISEYLMKGDEIIQKLPFVYRRLFVNEPLKEQTFYFKRSQEFLSLEKAFLNWQKGSYTPVLLYGEKGSGISTFIQMFVRERLKQKPAVYSVVPPARISREEDLIALMGVCFKGDPFITLSDLQSFADKHEPFVVFFDKLQLLFLRQPGGFNLLKKFFEIISQTSRKIFWICSCDIYTSLYLDKAIGLYDYFPVLIPMKNLTRDEVRKMIMLRHKASGYALHFKPSRIDLSDKNFTKKNPEDQQSFLREKYFESLNQHTRSNISLALQLWVRSAEKSENNQISLNSLDTLDFGFIFNLPIEVVFGLHALLVHEKLDVNQISQVLSISKRQAFLLMMRLSDRGIISEEKGIFSIHQLLYRQAAELLKKKNLIH